MINTIKTLVNECDVVGEVSNQFPLLEVLNRDKKINYYGSRLPGGIKDSENLKYIKGSKLVRDFKEECDLLYIDTIKNFKIKILELERYSPYVNKFILIRGTKSFSDIDELGRGPGLSKAINEFIKGNKDWVIDEVVDDMDGLTILKKQEIVLKKTRKKNIKNEH